MLQDRRKKNRRSGINYPASRASFRHVFYLVRVVRVGDICVACLVCLACFNTFARTACLLQLWTKTSDLDKLTLFYTTHNVLLTSPPIHFFLCLHLYNIVVLPPPPPRFLLSTLHRPHIDPTCVGGGGVKTVKMKWWRGSRRRRRENNKIVEEEEGKRYVKKWS